MKVIDLLNKIANGEVPKTIVYDERHFTYDDKRQNYFAYDDSEIDWKYTVMEYINDEIEIIEDKPFNKRVEEIYNRHIDYIYDKEDKKIEKLREPLLQEETLNYVKLLKSKINEIIDYINKENR